ncbi:hypothetical protein [Chamaesiphon polymorphus]|uniref:Uncharacterized protein n=1 Tax=Chamaesiphon polymorphus CCALA 037 TaxID=2107692 RepID=A0A2T1FT10_9CYAN|nr:hypothetical protein [Chamaesiphon polymorphus]PSB48132.1 hypothetical protein C7B77_23985 [Chamaesiphon polymorphus CCALA 037]
MAGSIIIAAADPQALSSIASIEDLESFVYVELDRLVTLDLEILAGSGDCKWASSEPIVYDPDGGMAIFKIDDRGLAYIIKCSADENSLDREDLQKLAKFVQINGNSNIYELATF